MAPLWIKTGASDLNNPNNLPPALLDGRSATVVQGVLGRSSALEPEGGPKWALSQELSAPKILSQRLLDSGGAKAQITAFLEQ